MNAQEFAYWLHGFTELTQGQTPNPAQWKSICEHLDLVFKKVTPPVQTGPLPSTPDPMAGKSLSEMMREYLESQKQTTSILPFDWTKTTLIC